MWFQLTSLNREPVVSFYGQGHDSITLHGLHISQLSRNVPSSELVMLILTRTVCPPCSECPEKVLQTYIGIAWLFPGLSALNNG